MTGAARLALYAVALGVVAAAAAGVGFAVGPLGGSVGSGTDHRDGTGAATRDHGADAGGHATGGADAADADAASGLAVSHEGYTLELAQTRLPLGEEVAVRYRIVAADGRPVRDFELEGGVRMHLIVVRRDLVGYQHVHPELGGDGTFTTRLTLPSAGSWRAFADFERHGKKVVLAADLFVPGPFTPEALPAPARRASVGGYDVELAAAAPRAGREAEISFRVARAGRPVALDPYLGARGHLVALRAGDLAYLHVHPLADAPAAGKVAFAATFPTAGRYRLVLQFRDRGRVRTAAFTLEVRR